MTRQEADALKTYIDFMAEQTAAIVGGPINYKDKYTEVGVLSSWTIKITEEAAAAFKEAIAKDFDKSREGFDIGAGIIFDSNPRSGFWVHDEFIKEEAGPVKREGFPNFKNKPTHYATWNEPQNPNPHVMQTLSFAEFKELETYPDRCQVYAHKSLRDTIIKFAENLGYKNTAEVPRSEEASILEFTNDDENTDFPGVYEGVTSLGNLLSNFKLPTLGRGASRKLTFKDVIEFAKLVRVLTIEETTAGISARLTVPDGAGNFIAVPWVERRPDETIIKLPKDFTL